MAGNSKNALLPYHLVNAGNMVSTITSAATNIQFLDNLAVQIQYTGTPVGSFTLQGSLDHQEFYGTIEKAGTWINITLSPPIPDAAGSAGQVLINMTQLSFPWLRVVFTAGMASAGSLDVYISGKSV